VLCVGIDRSVVYRSAEFHLRGSNGPEVIAI